MRFLRVGALLCLLCAARPLSAQTPDDRYLSVYSLVEQADQIAAKGDTRAAVNRYLEAQVALKDLQQRFPTWNPPIVSYRLDYISGKLGPLTGGASNGANAGTAATKTGAGKDDSKELQANIAQLAEQNAYLEAKLREALKIQPASADPRELERAEDRIKALQKERDLLALTLEQTRNRPLTGADADEARQQNQVTQTAVADVLQRQNEELQKRIAELQIRLQGGNGTGERVELKEAIAALQASNRVMKAEQVAMENRLMEIVKGFHAGSSQREKEWEAKLAEARAAAEAAKKERDDLLKKLDSVTHELTANADKPNANTAALEKQLESIQARLQIFEAKAVPYSAEELALFKQAPLKVAPEQVAAAPSTNTTTAAGRKKNELPLGSSPLLHDAERAIDAGRFDEAEQKLRDILRQDENQPYVLTKLAAVQMDQDKTSEADVTLKKALAIDPQDPASLYLLGSLRVRQAQYDDAIDLLGQAVKLAPDNPQSHYYLAQALVQKGQRKPAETELRRVINLKPGWGEAHYMLAVIYATQEPNFKGLAQYHYKKAIAGGAARNPELERWMDKPASAGPATTAGK